MRFRSSSSPPPYLNRRDQVRLLLLVGLLAGVLVAIQVVANPRMWSWMFPAEEPAASQDASDPDASSDRVTGRREIDFGVRFEDESPLADDEFRLRAPAVDRPAAGDEGTRDSRRDSEQADADAVPRDGAGSLPELSAAARAVSPRDPHDVSLDPALFREVRDDYVGLRVAEADAYYRVLSVLRGVDQRALAGRAETVDFAILMDDPDRFRGRPVTVEGEIRALTPLPDEQNDAGIGTLWEAWLFNRSSWPNPWCIRALEVPESIPQGSRISQPVRVRVTGYFFKKYGYPSEGGFHKAPLILAKQIEWLRSDAVPATPLAGLGPWLLGLAVAIAAGLGVMVWRFRVSDRRFEQTHLKRLSAAPREAIAALDGVETTDVSDLFRRLAEEDSSGPAAAADREDPGDAAPGRQG